MNTPIWVDDMTTIGELAKGYTKLTNDELERDEQIEQHIDALEEEIKRLKERKGRDRNSREWWGDYFLRPIAEALIKKYYPDYEYEILGSFGLQAITSIHFLKKGIPRDDQYHTLHSVKSITFVPSFHYENDYDVHGRRRASNMTIAILDESKDTKRFKEGTIGELNGMNHPEIELSPDMSLEELNKYVG